MQIGTGYQPLSPTGFSAFTNPLAKVPLWTPERRTFSIFTFIGVEFSCPRRRSCHPAVLVTVSPQCEKKPMSVLIQEEDKEKHRGCLVSHPLAQEYCYRISFQPSFDPWCTFLGWMWELTGEKLWQSHLISAGRWLLLQETTPFHIQKHPHLAFTNVQKEKKNATEKVRVLFVFFMSTINRSISTINKNSMEFLLFLTIVCCKQRPRDFSVTGR